MNLIPVIWVPRFLLARQSMVLCTFLGPHKDLPDLIIRLIVLDELTKDIGSICRRNQMPPGIGIEGFGRPPNTSIPSKCVQYIHYSLDLFLRWSVGSGSSKDIGLGGLVVDPVGVGKESFSGYKLSGQPSRSHISITSVQPVGRIQVVGIIYQSMSLLKTFGLDSDFYPETSDGPIFFAG
jgi:hypothetical protein